jgi:uncharacterized membrane protein
MGYLSFFTFIGMLLVMVFLLIWIYQIKRNSNIQVKQNEKIIELLKEKS